MSSVFSDLRHRKLVQWALAYLAGAWLVLQVATTVGTNFGWPSSVLRGLTILLAIGFPIILVLAWYHGERGQQRVSGPELLMIAALLIVAGAALALVRREGEESRPPSAETSTPAQVPSVDSGSIAVLPFANLSGDPEQEFFSDGMTEEIIGHLAKVEGLTVISRTSVMRYKETDKSLRDIARELGVATVLEGSVRREGDRVRVSAQLVDASTDAHLWSESYDREIESVFAIQSDVATSIARALEVELTSEERQRIERAPTSNQEAYQLYLRGRNFWNRRTFEDLDRALDLFQQAVAADPGFALAHVGIAETYLLLPQYGPYPREDGNQRAEAAARQALKFDPTSGEAYATLGAVALDRWQWDRADQFYTRAVELSPGYATGHQWYGEYLYSVGRTREAVVELERARQLDPQSMIITTVLAMGYYYDRRYEEAIATARAATEMTEEVIGPYTALFLALQASRRFPEAIETLSTGTRMMAGPEAGDRVRAEFARGWREQGERGYWEAAAGLYQTVGQGRVPTVPAAVAYLHAGDRERAFDWLERSIEQRSAGTTYPDIFFDPGLDPIRDDPRFVRLLERMGLPPSNPR